MPEVWGDVTGYALHKGDRVYSRDYEEEGYIVLVSSPDGDVIDGIPVYHPPTIQIRLVHSGMTINVRGVEVELDLYKFEDLEKR